MGMTADKGGSLTRLIWTAAALVATVALAAISVASWDADVEASGHSATRAFAAPWVAPGGTMEVSITARGYGALGRVIETLPEGFGYAGSTLPDSGVKVEGATLKFTLLGEERFAYTVTAPAAEGQYSFSGALLDANVVREVVGGDTLLRVGSEPTATPTPGPPATPTSEPTATPVPGPSATDTPEPTATPVPEPTLEPTATHTPVPTATLTPEPTATHTPEPTATHIPQPTATHTPEPTATLTLEPTATPAPEPSATLTPEPTATPTPEPSAMPAPLPIPTPVTTGGTSGGAPALLWVIGALLGLGVLFLLIVAAYARSRR